MGKIGRPGMSDTDKAIVWQRWRAGDSIVDISRQLDKRSGSIFTVLRTTGGYSSRVCTRRTSSLTLHERESISRGIAAGKSMRAIARGLGRCASTISREIKRHGGNKHYRACKAEERALEQASRPQPTLLSINTKLREVVIDK